MITYTHPVKLWLLGDGQQIHLLAIGHCLANQSFYRQVAGYWRRVGDHRVG